jgi:hypothetical protein
VKLRHVRAVAVFVGVVVALTGARHSSGGGCSNDSSDSSHSSSTSGGTTGGSSHYDDDDDVSSTTGGSGSGNSRSTNPARDVKIDSCAFDEARGIVAQVSATNSSASTTYTYKFSVTFEDPDGAVVRTSNSTIPYVSANSTENLDVAAAYAPKSGQNASGSTCRLSDVTRTAE